MSIPVAYLGVILIWSTTPLAIKWSAEEISYLFGLTGRMIIGIFTAILVLQVLRLRILWHRRARRAYLAAGLGIYASMLSIYWAAQFIPSGWISVIFGLTPITTDIMARIWLPKQKLIPIHLISMFVALAGLGLIFIDGLAQGDTVIYGIGAAIVSMVAHSASAVWIKRLKANLDGITMTTGGLMVAVPLFLLTWFFSGEQWPTEVEIKTLSAIFYLGVIGSVIGFALYFYILRYVDTTRVALITLVTPILALWIGNIFNNEIVDTRIWIGTVLIMLGLFGFEFGSRFSKQQV